ncbi:transposase [Nitrosomonas sp.]|jgi:putative transposase|uniref:REP-associated tyrosine transposase n=1 Tax=Nitrosomonas sp. TaxID=42353 RepID=UPI0035B2FFF7
MSNYRRNRVPGGTYFFTVNLLNRQSGLLVKHIDELRAAVRQTKRLHPFHIDAWVVLPDHLHCVWTLPENDADYSRRWQAIKKAFSKSIPPDEQRSKVQTQRNERGIWQRRFWEHTITSDRDYAAHIDYIHFNPVKHGWAQAVKDWPYSTFHQWVEQGVYPLGWAGCDESIADAGESPSYSP